MNWLFAAVCAAVAFAAPAHCDEIGFLTDIKAAEFTSDTTNTALVQVGVGICQSLHAGNSPKAIAREFFEKSQLSSLDRADEFVAIAQQDLCPETLGR